MPKGLKGFQKGNNLWKNPSCVKNQFKKGLIPKNYRGGVSKLSCQELRKKILFHYGGKRPKCINCGCDNVLVLTLDHKDNKGYSHRKKIGESSTNLYRWIIVNNFPNNFQLLCRNCNWLKYLRYLRSKRCG